MTFCIFISRFYSFYSIHNTWQMMTGSLVTEWLTVTTGLFSFFFLLSAFAWILSRDQKIDDVEKQHENLEKETCYIINNNTADSKNSIKTDITMPSPLARAMLPCTASKRNSSITIENDRAILNSPISHPLPSIPFFRSTPPTPPPTCILRPATHNHLTWWLHTKNHSTPDG